MSAPSHGVSDLPEIETNLVRFAQRLVQTPSLPGEERHASVLVHRELTALGYRDVRTDEVGNVVGFFGEGPNRLLFNGHLDHVPPSGMKRPYSGSLEEREVGGLVLRGRGSADMKANVACGAYAVAMLGPQALKGTYVFTADVQEETDSPEGIQRLLEEGLRADYGLSGEATNLDVAVGHRGKLRFELTVKGRASHASTPQDGRNAVFDAVPFLQALQELADRLPEDALQGRATVTVTSIRSEPEGDVAVVPHRCVISIDRRYIRAEEPDDCESALRALIDGVGARSRTEAELHRIDHYPLMHLDTDDPYVEIARTAAASVLGRTPPVRSWRFGVNATFMAQRGIPTVGIGPGSEDVAHTADEHVPISELIAATRIYGALVGQLCR